MGSKRAGDLLQGPPGKKPKSEAAYTKYKLNGAWILKEKGYKDARSICSHCHKRGHRKTFCPLKDTKLCSVCKAPGHDKRKCPSQIMTSGIDHVEIGTKNTLCSLCKMAGHSRQNCSLRAKPSDQETSAIDHVESLQIGTKSVLCSLCKMAGHSRQNCSLRAKPSDQEISAIDHVESLQIGTENMFCSLSKMAGHSRQNCSLRAKPSDQETIMQCSKCRRTSTKDYKLVFKTVLVNPIKRKFGENVVEGQTVCNQCYDYVTFNCNKPLWRDAWPSCIYSLLCNKIHSFGAYFLLQLLPKSIREFYENCKSDFSPGILSGWSSESMCFIDVTQRIKRYQEKIKLYDIAALKNALDTTMYPVTRCPQGCLLYPEITKDVTVISVAHWLAFNLNEFKSFGSDPKFFSGRNPTWPGKEKDLNWTFGSSLLIDPKNGLMIVSCSKGRHADGHSKYFHPPRNPFGNMSEMKDDILSPLVVSPYIARHAKTGKYNASQPVFKEYRCAEGLASFSLRTKPMFNDVSLEEFKRIGLAMDCREDIRYMLSSDGGPFQTTTRMNDALDTYRCKHKPPEDEIVKAVQSGTVIHKEEAVDLFLSSKKIVQRDGAYTRKQLNESRKTSIELVHPPDDVGSPLMFVQGKLNAGNANIEAGIYFIVTALLHCRRLFRSFHAERNKENDLRKLFTTHCVIAARSSGVKTRVCPIVKKLVEIIRSREISSEQKTPARIAAHILHVVSDGVAVKHLHFKETDPTLVDMTRITEAISIITVERGCKQPPINMNGWNLVFAAGYTTAGEIFFASKWSSEMQWQYSDGSLHSSNLQKAKYSFLIYLDVQKCENMNCESVINFFGGQSVFRCEEHKKMFMMKENCRTTTIVCSIKNCEKKINWRCSYGFGGSLYSRHCSVGVCSKHAQESSSNEGNKFIKPRDCSAVSYDVLDEKLFTKSEDSSSDSSDSEFECESSDLPHEEEADSHMYDPLVADIDYDDHEVLSTNYSSATFLNNAAEGTSGHYIISNFSNLRSRTVYGGLPIKCHRILTYIHSIVEEKNLPFLFLEHLLFPQIFYVLHQGCPVGALPSVFYSEFGRTSLVNGYASLVDHLRVRLSDPTLLTSKDKNYIAFSFDVYMHRLLQHNSVRVAMRKGFEHITNAGVSVDESEFRLPYNEIDSRREVSRLSKMIKHFPWSFFVTITCNMRATMGIWPLRMALEDKYGADTKELELALQNYAVIFCKAWLKVITCFFEYLVGTKEDILGSVTAFYVRIEFQGDGAIGNLPHGHAGLSLDKNSKYTPEKLCTKVHNKISKMFNFQNGTDFKSLLKRGIVEDLEDYANLVDLAQKIFVHSCEAAKNACHKSKPDGSQSCRVPVYLPGWEAQLDSYSNEFDQITLELLCLINLATKVELDGNVEYNLDDILKCGRWNYPTEPGLRSVPSNGMLFSVFQSMVNVQVCGLRFMTSYLAKYMTKLEHKHKVYFSTRKGSSNIDANFVDDAKKNGRKGTEETYSSHREIGLFEMLWKLFEFPYSITNIEFEHYSTHPPEHRYCIRKCRKKPKNSHEGSAPIVVLNREALPTWRQFTSTQVLLVRQLSHSNFIVDRTTSFSLRPPELLFLKQVETYVHYFKIEVGKFEVGEDIHCSPLVDGLGRRVRVRIPYVTKIFDILDSNIPSIDSRIVNMHNLFKSLKEQVDSGNRSDYFALFVDESAVNEVVPVMSNVDVKNPGKFLIHLVISLGEFETEYDLFQEKCLYDSFVKAGLIDLSKSPDENWRALCEKYARQQLVYFPLSMRMFSAKLLEAAHVLKAFTYEKAIEYSMPICLESSMKENAQIEVQTALHKKRVQLISSIVQHNIQGTPSMDVMVNNDIFEYTPDIAKASGQSMTSYGEQLLAKEYIVNAIDNYSSCYYSFVKFPLLMGPPGAGKTYILLICCLYAISKGLRCALSALTGERARMLGGEHLHSLFGFPVGFDASTTPSIIAPKCLDFLSNNHLTLAYLKTLDVLFLEEISLIPGFMLNVMDYVLRVIRQNEKPYGGILIISSGDHKQLDPIDGGSMWLGSECIVHFDILLLKHYVRCSEDKELEGVLEVFRKSAPSQDEVEYVSSILKKRCSSSNVESWDDVPEFYFRIVGKVKATEIVIDSYVKQKKGRYPFHTSMALDEMKNVGYQWIPANSNTTKDLNERLREHSVLTIFKKAVMRLTYNCKKYDSKGTSFSQGQLVVILELPDPNIEFSKQAMPVKLVPPGERDFNVDDLPEDWTTFLIRVRTTLPCKLKTSYVEARRQQWPLTYYICNTVHKCIGETISYVATRLSCDGVYKIWERNQLLVLLSRVKNLSNLMFVGPMIENISAIREVLQMRNSVEDYIDLYVQKCNMLLKTDRFVPPAPFELNVRERVPSLPCGYVYMFISKGGHEFKIGVCKNLRSEIKKVNDVLSPHAGERNQLPWSLLCYATNSKGCSKQNALRDLDLFCELWIQSLNVQNITEPIPALECLQKLYAEQISKGEMTDLVIKQVFKPKEKKINMIFWVSI